MYKLIVSDIDGTLLTDDKKITNENKKAIHEAKEKGIYFILCTGRNKIAGEKILKELEINTPLVVSDGGLILDEKGNILEERFVPHSFIYKILDLLNEEKIYIEFMTDDKHVKYCPDKALEKFDLSKIFGLENNNPVNNIEYINSLEEFLNRNIKINSFCFASLNNTDKIYSSIKEIKGYESEIQIRNDLWGDYVFVMPNCSKDSGLDFLCKHYNICKKDIIAIGDELNDIEMIKSAGLGIAVSNAANRVKEVADYITVSNNNSAISHIIRKFILD